MHESSFGDREAPQQRRNDVLCVHFFAQTPYVMEMVLGRSITGPVAHTGLTHKCRAHTNAAAHSTGRAPAAGAVTRLITSSITAILRYHTCEFATLASIHCLSVMRKSVKTAGAGRG